MLLENLSRFQFAFTAMFHMTFPAITVGLAIFLTIVYAHYWRTNSLVYLQMFRFWRRIFAVAFALGVVSGTFMTFQFGLNWGGFAAKTGPVIAPIIAMEVVTAFFVEAGFIGVMLYGEDRVKKSTMFISCLMVALGTILSTTWIIAANSWMQTPQGFELDSMGRFIPVDWWKVMFTPAFVWRYPHMLLAVLLSSSLVVAGISAYYLLRGRAMGFAKRSFSISIGLLAVVTPLQLTVGDHVAVDVVGKYQPSKLQALEGNWVSTNTGYNLFVIPNVEQERNDVQVTIPWLGSAIIGDLSGKSPYPGMLQTPAADRPDPWFVFWGFRVMFYASMFFFAASMIGVVLRIKGKLYDSPRFHNFVMWLTPVGIFAIWAGWVTAESGRQPWVVFGHLRTADAVSHLASGQLIATVAAFLVAYLLLMLAFILFVVRSVRRGPERDHPNWIPPPSDAAHLDLATLAPITHTTGAAQ